MGKNYIDPKDKRDVRPYLEKITIEYLKLRKTSSDKATAFKVAVNMVYHKAESIKRNISYIKFLAIVGTIIDHTKIEEPVSHESVSH
jgi:hypothetical protein